MRRRLAKLIAATFWLLLWQGLSQLEVFAFYLASPLATIQRLWTELAEASFRLAAWQSLSRLSLGFLLGLGLALLAALLFDFFHRRLGLASQTVAAAIELPIRVLRALPTIPLIVLLLFVLQPASVPLYIALCLSLQTSYPQLRSALASSHKLNELGRVYRLSRARRFWLLRLGQLLPSLATAGESSLALSLKSAIAAELFCYVQNSLGIRFYEAKIYLDSSLLFALIILLILLASLLTRLYSLLLRSLAWLCLQEFNFSTPLARLLGRQRLPSAGAVWAKLRAQSQKHRQKPQPYGPLNIRDLSFAYGDTPVFQNFSMSLPAGRCCVLNAASGRGKTTLLHLIAGLLTPQSGQIEGADTVALVPQELELISESSALDNVLIFGGQPGNAQSRQEASQLLSQLGLDPPWHDARLDTLSTGMRARVGLAAALLRGAPLHLLDETLSPLDPDNQERALKLLRESGASILLVSHQPELAADAMTLDFQHFGEI